MVATTGVCWMVGSSTGGGGGATAAASCGCCCWTTGLFGEGVLSEGWPLRRALVISRPPILCPGDAIGDGIGAFGYSGVVVALPTLGTAALDFALFV